MGLQQLQTLRDSLARQDKQKKLVFDRAKQFVEIALVTLGGLIATAAPFFTEELTWPPGIPQTVGLVGLAVSAIGVVFLVMTKSEPDNLYEASQAISLADSNSLAVQDAEREILYSARSARQFRSLYLGYASARSMLERAVAGRHLEEETLLADVLLAMRLDLRIALGFETDHTWTIVIYKARIDETDGYRYLHCIAHDRSIECEISKARKWKEGIGVGGIAFAKNDEVVAPDILEASAVSLFSLNGGTLRDEDRRRYRSMFAVPVQVGSDPRPWGVALASCSEADHFLSPEYELEDDAALNNKEGMRALAGLVALAVVLCRQKDQGDKMTAKPWEDEENEVSQPIGNGS